MGGLSTDLVLDQPLRPLMELVEVSLVGRATAPLDRLGCGFDATSITGVIGLDGDETERPTGRAALRDLVTGHALPSSGTLRFGGLRIDQLGPTDRVRLGILAMRRHRLLPAGSVREMLFAARLLVSRPARRLALQSGARPTEEDSRDIAAILDFVEIDGLADRPVASLGGLEARLAELARCLAQRPRLLLLEHPFARLAPDDRAHFARLLTRLRKAALALVVIDDDLATLGRIADRCLVLDRGRLIADATPAAIGASTVVYRLLTGSAL
jgi:ABC-type branched-subunit amino acid transport system ATPase component